MQVHARHPLLIIGLDGATFDVLYPLFLDGRLPSLQQLCDRGMRTELRSTVPPATFPAWTSLLTGRNPGEHGLVDMFVRPHGTYQLQPAGGHLRSTGTFLRALSRRGLRVASLGVPGTYPPEQINGISIAGFDAPGAARARADAVWPPAFWQTLERWGGWRYATFNEQRRSNKARALDALLADLTAKERVILGTYALEPWDVFMVHLQATDTVGHHAWHLWDSDSPRATRSEVSDALPRVYARIDQIVGKLLTLLPEHGRVLVVSDHGMGGASDIAVHLNRWLAARGLLSFSSSSRRSARSAVSRLMRTGAGLLPTELLGSMMQRLGARRLGDLLHLTRGAAIDFGHSQAFSDELDYAPSIWINRAGVFPQGRVTAGEAEILRRKLREDLLELRDPSTHTRLVRAVHLREEVLSGPYVERAPDLFIEPAWPRGYRPSFLSSPGPGPVVRRMKPHELDAPRGAGMPGVHRPEGVFIAWGDEIPAMEIPTLRMTNVAALVFAMCKEPVPADLFSSLPAFIHEVIDIRRGDPEEAGTFQPALPVTEGSVAVLERLRDLGYVD